MSSIAAAFNTKVENISRDRVISSRKISYTNKLYIIDKNNNLIIHGEIISVDLETKRFSGYIKI